MKAFHLKLVSVLGVLILLTMVSCKKDSKEEDTTDDTVAQTQQSADEASYTAETENTLNDVNDAMSAVSFGKAGPVSGATIDSLGPKKIAINYDGNSKDGLRYRKGQVIVELTSGSRWRDAGAVLTVTINNLKITRISTGKTITLSGSKTITNVNGGLASQLTPGNSIVHRINGTMSVIFEDGTSRSWTISRQRVIGQSSNGKYYVSIKGTGTYNGDTNVVVIGTNRLGREFYTTTPTPVRFTEECGWLPQSGSKVHKKIDREITVAFGVDMSGNPNTTGCAYGYKINWTNIKGEAKQAIISY